MEIKVLSLTHSYMYSECLLHGGNPVVNRTHTVPAVLELSLGERERGTLLKGIKPMNV